LRVVGGSYGMGGVEELPEMENYYSGNQRGYLL